MALSQTIDKLTKDEIEEYKAAFDFFDTSGDGLISHKELKKVLKQLGHKNCKDKDVQATITQLDTNRNGQLDFDEFLHFLVGMISIDKKEETLRAFQTFDINNDGFISKQELEKTMKNLNQKLSKEEIDNMIGAVDVNGDGKIDYKEFLKMNTCI